MSYLFPQGDSAQLGVLQVGANINVDANSIISIPQSVATTTNITFATVNATAGLFAPAITDSSLTAGRITFAGTGGLLVDSSNLTFSTATNTLSVTNVAVANALTLNGASVVTKVTPSAGPGISITGVVSTGTSTAFTVNNTGVLSLTAGTGIAISTSTGNITVSATGATVINTRGTGTNYTLSNLDDYVGATASSITLTLPLGSTGQSFILKNEAGSGACTVAATAPDTIDGAATKSLSSNAAITVVFRAGAWRII